MIKKTGRIFNISAITLVVSLLLTAGIYSGLISGRRNDTAVGTGRAQEADTEADALTSATPEKLSPKEAMFYQKLENSLVQCLLCFRKCEIAPGKTGFCRVRENRDGTLYSLVYSRPSAVQREPIEKEPMFHYMPGADILCIGTVGCNFRCLHCHNWQLSQASPGERGARDLTPEMTVELAKHHNLPAISFTYNDPIVCYEYLYETAKIAQKEGIRIIWHSNGSINPEPLEKLLDYTDAVTIDLKAVSDDILERMSGAKTEPVLRTIRRIQTRGVWLELVNLVVTGMNDSEEHISALCRWVRENIGADVPLHFTRFFPAYKYTSVAATPVSRLENAYSIARKEGINHVFIGNVPGHEYNSTFCPGCGAKVVNRSHFQVISMNLEEGSCGSCGRTIAGIWN